MDFGDAVRHVMTGGRARRAGWNGRGMWIAYTHPSVLQVAGSTLRGAARIYAETENPQEIKLSGHFDMRAADGTLVIGWLASQTDMAAEDWEAVE